MKMEARLIAAALVVGGAIGAAGFGDYVLRLDTQDAEPGGVISANQLEAFALKVYSYSDGEKNELSAGDSGLFAYGTNWDMSTSVALVPGVAETTNDYLRFAFAPSNLPAAGAFFYQCAVSNAAGLRVIGQGVLNVQRSPITGGNFTLSLLTRLNWAQFSFVGNGPWLSDLAAISNAAARAEALAIAATNNTAAALALANNALVVANSASGAVVVAQRAANAAGVTGATAIAAANSVSGRVDAIQAAGYITNRQGGVSLTGDFSETNADFTYDVMGVFSDPTIAGRYAYSGTNAGGGMIWTNGRGGTMLKDSGSGGDGANKDIYNGDASYYAEARSVTNDIWPHFPSAWTVTAGSGVPFIGSPNFKLRVVGGTEAGDYHAVSELGGIGWRSDVGNSTIYYNTALNLVYIEGTTLYQSEGMGYIGVTFHKGPGDPDTCAIIPIPLSIPARAKNTEDALFSQVNNTPAYVPKSATNGWETGSHAGYAQTSVISTQVWSAAQLVNGAFLPAFTNATTLQPGALNGTNGLYFVPPSSTNRYWILGGM